MSQVLSLPKSTDVTRDLQRRAVDLLSAAILAALVVKLFFMQVDGGGLESGMSWMRAAKFLFAAVSSHVALFVGLLSVCIFVGRTQPRARAFALAAHVAILAVAYLDFLLARYQGFHASYVQFGVAEEGWKGLPTLFSVCEREDLWLLVDFPIYAALLLFANLRGWVWMAPRWVAAAGVVWFLAWNAFLFTWVGRQEERFFLWNTNSASLPATARKFTYPVRQAINVLFAATNRGEPYELPGEIPSGLPRSAAQGAPRTPHLMIIQVESLPGGAIEWDVEGQAVTPFLREFAAKGAYFTNTLSTKMAGGSFDADIAVLTGFHPPENSNPYAYRFSHPPYFSHLLQRAGYTNFSFYNYVPEFFRAKDNHAALGLPHFVSIRDRAWSTELPRLGVSGPGDREFLAYVRDELLQADKPVFYFVRTASNHGPWGGLDEYEEVRDTVKVEFPGDATMRGLAAGLRYDDIALRGMLTPLLPLIESGQLLVVIYGDHGIGIRLQANQVPGVTEKEMLVRHVPLIFVGKDIKPLKSNQLASLQDVSVTLANFLGVPFAEGELGGRDLFAAGELQPLVTPWAVFHRNERQPVADEHRSLLHYGYGKMAAPR